MGHREKFRVLFVCIGNACRSPIAEAIARKDAADVIEPLSAGLYPLGRIEELTEVVLKCNEYSAEGLASKGLRNFSPKNVDLVVNMSGLGGPLLESGYLRFEEWNVEDPYGQDETTYQRILEEIQGRVRDLAQRLREKRDGEEQ
jgi:arsenate reductase